MFISLKKKYKIMSDFSKANKISRCEIVTVWKVIRNEVIEISFFLQTFPIIGNYASRKPSVKKIGN